MSLTWYDNGTGTTSSSLFVSGNSISISSLAETSTPSGTRIAVQSKKQIHPRLYFKFVKSKINKTNLVNVEKRMIRVQKLLKNFEEMGQDAPFEALIGELFKLTKHAEAIGSGYDMVVDKKDIDRFMGYVNANNKVVKYSDFTNFPRPVPKDCQEKILAAKRTKIFDNFKVLYLDYSGEEFKTTKQKIIEKDPIVFGVYNEDPDKHFFVADWVDNICDLTLMQFVDKMRDKEPLYELVDENRIDEEFLKRIKEEYETKKKRLSDAGRSNYKELAKDEEIDRLKKELAKTKKSFLERLMFWK